MARTKLRIEIARPCPVSWQSMAGDGRRRFCAVCQKSVFNVEEMTLDEVLALARDAGQAGACVRIYRRADGTVMTNDCSFGLARAALKLRRTLLRGVGAALGALVTLVGLTSLFGDDLRRMFGTSVSAGAMVALDTGGRPARSRSSGHLGSITSFATESVSGHRTVTSFAAPLDEESKRR